MDRLRRRPALTAADGVVGLALIAAGLVAWGRRAEAAVGPIMTAAGFAWFLGTFGGLGAVPPPRCRSRTSCSPIRAVAHGRGWSARRSSPPTPTRRSIRSPPTTTRRSAFAAGLVAVAAYALCDRRRSGAPGARVRPRSRRWRSPSVLALRRRCPARERGHRPDGALGLRRRGPRRRARARRRPALGALGTGDRDGTRGRPGRSRLSRHPPGAARAGPGRSDAWGRLLPARGGPVRRRGRAAPSSIPADEPGRAVTPIDDAGTPVAALVHDPPCSTIRSWSGRSLGHPVRGLQRPASGRGASPGRRGRGVAPADRPRRRRAAPPPRARASRRSRATACPHGRAARRVRPSAGRRPR